MSVSVEAHVGPWSEEDFLALPDGLSRYELLEGALVVNPSPAPPHQILSRNLMLLLHEQAPEGLEVFEAVGVRCLDGSVLIPDVLVVERAAALANRSGILSAQDVFLVVEIVSPSSRTADRVTKPAVYARAGIPAYWRVEPEGGPMITAYRLEGEGYVEVGTAQPGRQISVERPFAITFDPARLAP